MIYASGINGKAGLAPDNLAEDLGPLFETIVRCIPGPHIDKDGPLQMLVSDYRLACFSFILSHAFCIIDFGLTHFDLMQQML